MLRMPSVRGGSRRSYAKAEERRALDGREDLLQVTARNAGQDVLNVHAGRVVRRRLIRYEIGGEDGGKGVETGEGTLRIIGMHILGQYGRHGAGCDVLNEVSARGGRSEG